MGSSPDGKSRAGASPIDQMDASVSVDNQQEEIKR
jgi:hypothetical protein